MLRRIDTDRLKRAHLVEEVVARYGVDLRPVGRALVGRCPLHDDGGRPNLHVYPGSASWYCYRCAIGGDVISFVMRLERLRFLEAVTRLEGGAVARLVGPHQPPPRPAHRPKARRSRRGAWGPAERACLAATVELYHNRLLTERAALAYVQGRGLEQATFERCRVGYAGGDELADYLRWRHLPVRAAVRAGLLGSDGRELMAGRVVVPELRGGQPIWLVGRAIDPETGVPKYLGLPGTKPLLGWEGAVGSPTAVVVEGVFDWLTLVQWGFPAVALVGTHVRTEELRALGGRFRRLYLALDADDVGRAATDAIARALGPMALPVSLPPGVKDVAELALRPGGRALFARALGPKAPEPALVA
ncbi:MAG: CHC2 zinc finger domain-containing protein [Dehalococcoidia bacterium]